MLTLIHIVGQILFGGYFLYQGINHFVNHKGLTGYAASQKVPAPSVAIFGSGVLLILGGLGVLFNMYTLVALILLVLFLVPVTVTMHAFWKETDANAKASQKIAFLKNVALLGAVLLMMQW